jgi:hypothetical protein
MRQPQAFCKANQQGATAAAFATDSHSKNSTILYSKLFAFANSRAPEIRLSWSRIVSQGREMSTASAGLPKRPARGLVWARDKSLLPPAAALHLRKIGCVFEKFG